MRFLSYLEIDKDIELCNEVPADWAWSDSNLLIQGFLLRRTDSPQNIGLVFSSQELATKKSILSTNMGCENLTTEPAGYLNNAPVGLSISKPEQAGPATHAPKDNHHNALASHPKHELP